MIKLNFEWMEINKSKIKKAQLNCNKLIISNILITMDKPIENEFQFSSHSHRFNLYLSNPWLSRILNLVLLSSRYQCFILCIIHLNTHFVSWTIFFFNCFMSLFNCEISLSLFSSIEFNSSFCFSSCAWMLHEIQMLQ